MTLKKLLSDTAQFLIPGRYVKETGRRGIASMFYSIAFVSAAMAYGIDGCDTGAWTLSGQSRVKQERTADREQLRSLVDSDENGVSLQEYNDFREVTGSNPIEPFYSSRLAGDIRAMGPDEVKAAIGEYKDLEQ